MSLLAAHVNPLAPSPAPSSPGGSLPPGPAPRARRPVLPTSVLGTLIFVVVATMCFAGLMSAMTISRSVAAAGTWPPVGAPPLPVGSGALTLGLLVASAGLVFIANRRYARTATSAVAPVLAAGAVGLAPVAVQGASIASLWSAGLGPASGAYGGFFFLVVGLHTLFTLGGATSLVRAGLALKAGRLTADAFFGTQTFWYFVAGLWPVVFARVYF